MLIYVQRMDVECVQKCSQETHVKRAYSHLLVCVCVEVVLLWLTAYISWLKCLKETILTSPWTSAASSVYEVVAYNGLLVHICNMNDLKWLISHMSTPQPPQLKPLVLVLYLNFHICMYTPQLHKRCLLSHFCFQQAKSASEMVFFSLDLLLGTVCHPFLPLVISRTH